MASPCTKEGLLSHLACILQTKLRKKVDMNDANFEY